MVTKNGKVITYDEEPSSINLHNFLKMWSRDKLKTYLHHNHAYGYQTCQDGDIALEAPTHKFA